MDTQNIGGEITSSREYDASHPSPAKLEEYIPWACHQLQIEFNIIVKKIELKGYNSSLSTTPKGRKSQKIREDVDTDSEPERSLQKMEIPEIDLTGTVFIYTIYDGNKNLTQMKFLKNIAVPDIVIKVIALAIPFHPNLTTVYIDRGLNQSAVYELWKLISVSKITEAILDDTNVIQANYYILLGKNTPLKYLSLARCKINDAVIENIAQNLACPMAAGKCLSVLNLSTNRITDVGAKYIGDVLKINRKLCYLNLSGNMLTDIGAAYILDSLKEFALSSEDIQEKRTRCMVYLRKKNELIKKIAGEMRVDDFEKPNTGKKSRKPISPTPIKKGKLSDRSSITTAPPLLDNAWYEKAESIAVSSLGNYKDAYEAENTIIISDITYCLGNNVLCCLNLAHNNLSYISVKKIYDVLCTQKNLNRQPKGLLRICINGNNIPEFCAELSEIDSLIGSLMPTSAKGTSTTKKTQNKSFNK